MNDEGTRLWILQPESGYGNYPPNEKQDNPWKPPWDCYFGFVVEATSEDQARALAHDQKGDEGRRQHGFAWLDKAYTSCVPLVATGESRIVMHDFWSG